MRNKKIIFSLIAVITAISYCSISYAAGFQILPQSAADIGTAVAGSAANSNNSSTEFYNPAGMTKFQHPIFSISTMSIFPATNFNASAATDTSGTATTGNSGNPHSDLFLPTVHYVQPLGTRLAVGFGVTSPYALKNDYGSNSLARYVSTTNSIESVNISPSLALRINNKLSIGVGFDAQHLIMRFAKHINSINTGLIIISFSPDATRTDRGSDWGYGWNAGIIYNYSPATTIGFAYRSAIKHHLRGNTNFQGLPAGTGIAANNSSTSNVTLPDSYTLSAAHQINPRWNIFADLQFTNWSRIKNITFTPSTTAPSATVALNYKNSWRIAAASSYQLTQRFAVHGGVAFDQSPNNSDSAQIPDSNSYWLACGANIKLDRYIDFDLDYAHIFYYHYNINQNSAATADSSATLQANYKKSANIIGAQINVHLMTK